MRKATAGEVIHTAKLDLRFLRSAAAAFGVVVLAALCRSVAQTAELPFADKLANFVRFFLYFSLFAIWGASVQRRVIQAGVRRILVAVALLMIFWLTVRELRWHLVPDGDLRRWLWYLYYIPIMLIPLLALLASMSMGRVEQYRLPRWTALLFVPTLLLAALALTNDLHQWMFRFPADMGMQGELDYRYGLAYYLATGWAILCALAAFLILLRKCRVRRTRMFLWLPLAPFGVAVIYVVLYALRVPLVVGPLGDLAAFVCLAVTAFFECCIRCGLIQSNARYSELFRASAQLDVQITDLDYTVRYAASGAEPIPTERMRRAEQGQIILPEGKRLYNMPVNGGHVIWTENISELLRLRETLEVRQEELRDRSEFLKLEYEKEKEHRIVVEQNRLFDLLQSKTRKQLDRIGVLTEAYHAAGTEEEKRRILAEIVILGSFVKRRKDLVLSADAAPLLPERKLTSALQESLHSIHKYGIRGGAFVRTGREFLPGGVLAQAYDFFESVVEQILTKASYLNVRVCPVNGALRCAVETDCDCLAAGAQSDYPGARIVREEDGGTLFLLPLEGGGDT